jgi:hypothetical protein
MVVKLQHDRVCPADRGMRNGVSQLHGQVSRQMWQSLWPDAAEDHVAITQ